MRSTIADGKVCKDLNSSCHVACLVPVPWRINDVFRLVIVLLETCGQYFGKGAVAKRLDRFLAYLQRYVLSKPPPPLDVSLDLEVGAGPIPTGAPAGCVAVILLRNATHSAWSPWLAGCAAHAGCASCTVPCMWLAVPEVNRAVLAWVAEGVRTSRWRIWW
jgi:hypothetical protein